MFRKSHYPINRILIQNNFVIASPVCTQNPHIIQNKGKDSYTPAPIVKYISPNVTSNNFSVDNKKQLSVDVAIHPNTKYVNLHTFFSPSDFIISLMIKGNNNNFIIGLTETKNPTSVDYIRHTLIDKNETVFSFNTTTKTCNFDIGNNKHLVLFITDQVPHLNVVNVTVVYASSRV
jgi:hypothetical protein